MVLVLVDLCVPESEIILDDRELRLQLLQANLNNNDAFLVRIYSAQAGRRFLIRNHLLKILLIARDFVKEHLELVCKLLPLLNRGHILFEVVEIFPEAVNYEV